jgi:hypothetical protein
MMKPLLLIALLFACATALYADTTHVTVLKAGKLGGDVRDLDFHNIAIGYAVGDDISVSQYNFIAKTTDGGQTWNNITPPQLTSRPWTVEFTFGDTGFVGAYNGLLLRTTNAGQSWTSVNTSSYLRAGRIQAGQ